jgi:hypothetical protein
MRRGNKKNFRITDNPEGIGSSVGLVLGNALVSTNGVVPGWSAIQK